MGGEYFERRRNAKTAQEAFDALVVDARHLHGHGGYSGTIAEKDSFEMIERETIKAQRPDGGEVGVLEPVEQFLTRVHRIANEMDKWGPAACADLGPDPKDPSCRIWFFCGWASS